MTSREVPCNTSFVIFFFPDLHTQLEAAHWRQLAALKSSLEGRQEADLAGPQVMEGEQHTGFSEGPDEGACTSLLPVLAAVWPTGNGLGEGCGFSGHAHPVLCRSSLVVSSELRGRAWGVSGEDLTGCSTRGRSRQGHTGGGRRRSCDPPSGCSRWGRLVAWLLRGAV